MKALDFNLLAFHTNERVSLSDFKGKPIMLTFWVSWCPDCINDLKHKNKLFESMDTDKLAFLTINVTDREVRDTDGIIFMEENGYQFPVLKDKGRSVYDEYECTGVPTTVLIDEKFNIVAKFGDKTSFSEIMSGLNKII